MLYPHQPDDVPDKVTSHDLQNTRPNRSSASPNSIINTDQTFATAHHDSGNTIPSTHYENPEDDCHPPERQEDHPTTSNPQELTRTEQEIDAIRHKSWADISEKEIPHTSNKLPTKQAGSSRSRRDLPPVSYRC